MPQPMLSTRPGKRLPGLSSSATRTLLPGAQISELIFAHRRRDPARPRSDEAEQRLSLIDILAGGQPEVGDHAVGGRDYGGVGQVQPRLLDRGQRLSNLGIVIARGSEVLPRALKFRLGAPDVGLGLGNVGPRADRVGLGQRALVGQVDHDLAQLPARGEIDPLLLKRCLSDTDFNGRNAQPPEARRRDRLRPCAARSRTARDRCGTAPAPS